VKVFVSCFVESCSRQVPLEIPEWAKPVPLTSPASHRGARASIAKKGKFLTGQAQGIVKGFVSCFVEGCLRQG